MSTAALTRQSANAARRRTIVTPEGIALPLLLGSRSARAGALMIDLILIVVLIFATTLVLVYLAWGMLPSAAELDAESGAVARSLQFLYILWVAAIFLFRNAYFLYFELGPRGATPGKRMTGLRVAARDGGRLTAEMVIARNLVRDIELFAPVYFLTSAGEDTGAAGLAALGWFLIFTLLPVFNRDRLRAGDLIAGTWVVEAPREKLAEVISTGEAARGAASTATGAAYRFGDDDLAAYGEFELQTLERVLRDDRAEAMVAVHEAICRKLGWNPGAGDERAFLEAYYTQLRGRLESGMRMGKRKADKWT